MLGIKDQIRYLHRSHKPETETDLQVQTSVFSEAERPGQLDGSTSDSDQRQLLQLSTQRPRKKHQDDEE